MLVDAICKKHSADSAGDGVDKQFIESILYDRLLRLVRRHFACGTSDLIRWGVADKFSSVAQIFHAQQEGLTQSVADAEALNQPFGGRAVCKVCA